MEGLRRLQNTSGDEVARAKRQGLDTRDIQEANRTRATQIKHLSVQLDSVEHQRDTELLMLPNLPHATVPIGASAADNVEVRHHGEPRAFNFEPQAHWELGPALGIIDFERATRIAGARFSVLTGAGARLERALINFMLDLHTREHGYREIEPPLLVNAAALLGTGNLPNSKRSCSRLPATGTCISCRLPRCRSPTFTAARFSTAANCPFGTLRARRASVAKPDRTARMSAG